MNSQNENYMPQRPRRLRVSQRLRDAVCETRVHADQLIQPHFVLDQDSGVEAIPSMPTIDRMGRTDVLKRIEKDLELGIRSVMIFGLAGNAPKDNEGSAAQDSNGCVPKVVRDLKRAFGSDLIVMTDVCLCAYTDHGHCGVLHEGRIQNDPSLDLLARTALAHAEAGADVVAPSDMMDGRIGAMRRKLDGNGFDDVAIMSYAVKYASAYYGPFRDAADSAPAAGDRKTYQMDPRNSREALREAALDEAEGADFLMVKPALAYLDVIAKVRAASTLPLAAYNVSGEFSAVKAAVAQGWLDEAAVVSENLHAMVRAGADQIITYHAREALAGAWL
ncbi:MAG: porphobilinogen synthase [Planctomycetota bacterium]|jgi:porphobilinogen synthase